ncbi:MAG: DNA topoisomerase IB [Pseudomonadota bacterium]
MTWPYVAPERASRKTNRNLGVCTGLSRMNLSPDLIYYPDSHPGIRRKKRGRGFSYLAPDGTRIDQPEERARIESLAVPPAYEDVWISPKPNGHLQATGRDVRKRKQYRYHPDWTEFQAATKFDGLADFGEALPRIRRHIFADLKTDPGEQAYAIAATLALLDRTAIRIGTPEYADENGTFGATTLRSRHLSLDDEQIRLCYTGKGGKRIVRKIKDRTLNQTLNRLQDLPGAELITWLDDDGRPRSVTSDAINAALRTITECSTITAKTFRTWAGSTAAMEAALSEPELTIAAMADAASTRLANTPTIARNSYIHPAVIDLKDTCLSDRQAILSDAPEVPQLKQGERALLQLLRS